MEKEKVLVVGTGKSGIAATQLLLRTGKLPVLFDSNAELDKDEILGKLSLSGDEKKQVEIVLGDLTEEEKKELSGVVLSPGVPTDTEFVNDLRNRGLLISGEIELAFEQEKGAVLAITGTNGKTTTTTLLGEIMKRPERKHLWSAILEIPIHSKQKRQMQILLRLRRSLPSSWKRYIPSVRVSVRS